MCPISGSLQFLMIIIVLLVFGQFTFAQVGSWNIKYSLEKPTVYMYDAMNIDFNLTGPELSETKYLLITSENDDIVTASKEIVLKKEMFQDNTFSGNFSITGNFLGVANVACELKDTRANLESLEVTVVRKKRPIDTAFTSSVATLVSIIYINFGCALNWSELRTNLKRPIGPVIGFICQFLIMPLLSYALGKLIFPNNPAMQLGLFFTGVSPAGGASNVWTAILDGNIDLSITMTTISTFAAFGMMPLWLFTLGKTIFDDAKLEVPYSHIASYAIALVVPLFIGYLIQRFFKRLAHFLVRILKGFSSLLIIFIVIFAIVANLYLFKLFSWQIVLSGLGLPWVGYSIGWIMAKICKQEYYNSVAIAVETGVQNTGIAIFLLRFALPQPHGDLTTVVPVAVAIMTPVPLLLLFVIRKLRDSTETRKIKQQYKNCRFGSRESVNV